MSVTTISIGFGNYIVREKVTTVVGADSAPVRRAIQEARRQGVLIDATQGRRTKSVIYLDNSQMVVSGLSQDTLARRIGLYGETSD